MNKEPLKNIKNVETNCIAVHLTLYQHGKYLNSNSIYDTVFYYISIAGKSPGSNGGVSL